jgi:Planctomycete cytochrome C
MSGLRLDQKAAALKGGAAGVDILPGKSAGSRLIRLVAGLDQKFMPPVGTHLTATEVGILRAWIDQGLEWTDHPFGQCIFQLRAPRSSASWHRRTACR